MFLGPAALQIDAPGRLDALRKKLRGLTLLDALIMDDSLVPCIMLQAPQVGEGLQAPQVGEGHIIMSSRMPFQMCHDWTHESYGLCIHDS